MRWLALHLPQLSLETCCATLTPEQRQRPVVLLHEHRVSHANAAALACGIRPGAKRATALALAGDVLLAESNSARDAAALQAVAHVALAFTPAVTGHDNQTVLLEVQASLRLFGGLLPLWRRLLAELAPLGHLVHSAAAPTAWGAALLARGQAHAPVQNLQAAKIASAKPQDAAPGPQVDTLEDLQARLDDVPVWLLGPGREHWEALRGMGLRTLSDLRHLPRGGLVRRFGADLMDEFDRARGLQPDPRRWLSLPAVFESRLELYSRAENTDQVLSGAAVLLARLVAWAQGRHARVRAYTLQMQHERQRQAVVPATVLRIELAQPSLDAAHLQLLLRERLARIELAAPTLDLWLQCQDIAPGHAPNGELFPTRTRTAEGLTRLLERLRARLGDSQVLRLEAVADHRPECASRLVPAQGEQAPGKTVATITPPQIGLPLPLPLPLHRPAWLLPEPMPLAEREGLPVLEGRVLHLLSGPERIETGWWDDHPVARDYYIAQTADGSLVWTFRSRIPGPSGEVNWFLQGRYA